MAHLKVVGKLWLQVRITLSVGQRIQKEYKWIQGIIVRTCDSAAVAKIELVLFTGIISYTNIGKQVCIITFETRIIFDLVTFCNGILQPSILRSVPISLLFLKRIA